MKTTLACQFCRTELDLAQQFRYLVEAQTVENPIMMEAIRRLPQANGRPLRCCRGCQSAIERKAVAVRDLNARARAVGLRGGQLLMLSVLAVGLGVITARVVG